jgi:hypothetical protein
MGGILPQNLSGRHFHKTQRPLVRGTEQWWFALYLLNIRADLDHGGNVLA